ncbi:hypothetical protein SAMN04488134_10264 [Amphibacillus marinus]|uniref:Uncharacterized protein n=1 Tax=Amphibacillus marinus TaxID=872970 RepID=A0A1H8JTP8_9BACI|nr:hypothetical protein [Amphibacillus marinus]SEN83855.1 hypothetical protein SAMN04488134_10264 [Amphibacillus marinus]
MATNERDQFVIEQYEQGENEMILLFAQWCLNHKLDPYKLYQEAYPNQKASSKLTTIMEDVVELNLAGDIDTFLLLEALQAYGNDDLAWIVSQYYERL